MRNWKTVVTAKLLSKQSSECSQFEEVLKELQDSFANDSRKDWIAHMIKEGHIHKQRYCGMMALLRTERGKILDIGFNAVLASMYMDLGKFETELANFGSISRSEEWIIRGHKLLCKYWNVEGEQAPYENDIFDGVLFLEILEHMSIDPMMALQEINRITKKGGFLLLSTPNVISYRSLDNAINGRHPFLSSQYLKRRATDRHNREYTPNEIEELLQCAGYQIDYLITPSYYTKEKEYRDLEVWIQTSGRSTKLRGDTIVTRAIKVSSVINRYPTFLYFQ
jgi:SAM-dependent methyltransferase